MTLDKNKKRSSSLMSEETKELLTEDSDEIDENEKTANRERIKTKRRHRRRYKQHDNITRRLYIQIRTIIESVFYKYCRIVPKFFKSKKAEYRPVKAMLGFPFGLLYGYALQQLVLQQLHLTAFASHTLGWTLSLCLAMGFAFSSQVRCICILVIPTFFGRTGRAYINTYVITLVISGPIENLLSNAHESMRVLSCVAKLSINMTTERFKLMFSPVKDIIKEFAASGKKIHSDSQKIEKSYAPINAEVKNEEEVKESVADIDQLDKELGRESRVNVVKKKFKNYKKNVFGGKTEAKYGMKSELRCEEIFTKGVRGCKKSFGDAHDRCHSHLPIVGYLLCWPMKLDFICDLASSFMGKRSCDSKQVLSPGFGESVDTAHSIQKEFDKDFEVDMQYKLIISQEKVDQLTPEDVGKALENKFMARKRNFEFLMNILNRLLVFMFLQVFDLSRKYCNRYLRLIQYDNIYITSYFRRIDMRRESLGKRTLLPLKKGEKLELLDPFEIRVSVEEKGAIILNLLKAIGGIVTISIIIVFDRVFYEFLMLIQRHSHIEYRQTGVHHLNLIIHGNGFIGKLVRKILKGFDKKHNTDVITTTAQCLPLPSKLGISSIINIYLQCLSAIVLIFVESYGLRLRRVICSFFFPKREKKRILFLYNDRLKKRKSFMHYVQRKVKKMARKQAIAIDTGVLQSLRISYPKYFGWLGKLGMGKRKCLICEDIENKDVYFIQCSDECPFVYCYDCWLDAEEICYVCQPGDDESDLTDDEFSSD